MRQASSGQAEIAGRRHRNPLRRLRGGVAGAIAFLTIIPVPGRWTDPDISDMSDTVAWLPLVGAGLGAAAGAVRLIAVPLFGPDPSTALAMATLVILSGGLHQDALADFADGLGVRGERERRLAVMRDSTLGTFGVLALIGWGLLLFAALAPMSRDHALLALTVAGAGGRLAALVHARTAVPARSDGLGASFRVPPAAALVAAAIAAVCAIGLLGVWRGTLSLAVALAFGALTALCARRSFGGRTGDTLGTGIAVAEVAICLALLASWR